MKLHFLFTTSLLLSTLAACGSAPVETETREQQSALDEALSGGAAAPAEVAASATPYCNGATCNGKNPQGTNCQNSAYRVFGVGYPIGPSPEWGAVELWYSPACNANWARAYSMFGKPSVWVKQNGTKYAANGTPIQCYGDTCWSAMRNGTPLTSACGQINVYAANCTPAG